MRVSVCLSSYNTLPLTRACVEALLKNWSSEIAEVLVVDDASSDGSAEYLRGLAAPFKVRVNESNKGYAASNNSMAREATGDVLCFINADTLVSKNWLPPMLKLLKKEKAGMVGNVQWSPLTKRYDHAGMYFDEQGRPCHYGRGWRWAWFTLERQWPAVTAACCVIKRAVFMQMGGFDEAYKNGFEDTDLCMRLGAAGYTHWVAAGSVIKHYISQSPGRHVNEGANAALFAQRWPLSDRVGAVGQKCAAVDYLLRYLDRPWKYNGQQWWHSVRVLSS